MECASESMSLLNGCLSLRQIISWLDFSYDIDLQNKTVSSKLWVIWGDIFLDDAAPVICPKLYAWSHRIFPNSLRATQARTDNMGFFVPSVFGFVCWSVLAPSQSILETVILDGFE